MPAHNPTVPVRYTAVLFDLIESIGTDRSALLTAAGLPAELFDYPDTSMTLTELTALLEEVGRVTGREDLGFEVGRRIDVDVHGALGQTLQRCTTIDHALRVGSRFGSLVTPSFVIDYRRGADHAEVVYRPVAAMTPELMRFMFECHAGGFHNLISALMGRHMRPYDMYFSIQAPGHANRYRELAPARVHFAAAPLPELRIVFDSAQLDATITTAAPKLVALWENRCKSLVDHTQQEQPWSEWVSLMLTEAEDCQPTLEQLAALLNIGPHTLSRHLRREHQSFRALSNQVRYQRACRLLRESRTPVSQIAYRLGYQGVSAFSDAFRRVSGQGPRAYRNAHQQPA
jgi:AraC-like DNA-binding protein